MGSVMSHWDLGASVLWVLLGVRMWRALAAARAPLVEVAEGDLVEGSSLWRDAWRRLLKHRMAMAGANVEAAVRTTSPTDARVLYRTPAPAAPTAKFTVGDKVEGRYYGMGGDPEGGSQEWFPGVIA